MLDENPFSQRVSVPDFPKDATWLNTSGPLRKQDLKGKFVLLDFWTYCCINCMHVLPELKKLEHAYPNELVVIGVHSAKFEAEQETKNIEEAILRYEIEHPVINDADHEVWDSFGAESWPTILLVDPEGNAVWGKRGETKFEEVDKILKRAIPYYRDKRLLDSRPIHFERLAYRQEPSPLRFPGKILADEAGNRLFISDSNHNRIVITSLDGKVQEFIGSGQMGRNDGGYAEASFDHPQGLALQGGMLFVADTENHLLRKVDLAKKQVTTIAGVGDQGRSAWPGLEELTLRRGPLPDRWVGQPLETALNSPWDLWVHKENLYIAMAGPHQIWKMPLDASEIGPYAGNGREDIVDGPLLPQEPYASGFASFAQPSGLASDGQWLFVADSEGSSIRAVPFDPTKNVRTIVGTAHLPQYARLFTFGDQDGPPQTARLQHVLGVVYRDGKIYAADTYNNKIKIVDAKTGEVKTLAGTGQPGGSDEAGTFDEPAGIAVAGNTLYVADTNNHRIRTVDIQTGKVGTLAIAGLEPVTKKSAEPAKPKFPGATRMELPLSTVQPSDGQIQLSVKLTLPDGWKINPLAPMKYFVELDGDKGPIDRQVVGATRLEKPSTVFQIPLRVTGEGNDRVSVSMSYFYCQEGGEGLCRVGSVVFDVPVKVDPAGPSSTIDLSHTVRE